MFKTNKNHLQSEMFSTVSKLPEMLRTVLDASWASTFYREVFNRINEEVFSVLYSSSPSRPNVPVNVLVGLELLKAGNGWSDAELYEHFLFDIQVRYALGYTELGDGTFAIRTLYYFRDALSKYDKCIER
ncbi:MAG: transposase [Anaerolineales bacterium]|nr:transposase [Anaerolineales bacterium]